MELSRSLEKMICVGEVRERHDLRTLLYRYGLQSLRLQRMQRCENDVLMGRKQRRNDGMAIPVGQKTNFGQRA
jgi:hypothetical protein